MISKPVPANSFYHTCRYICQKKGAEILIAEGVRSHNYKVMAQDFSSQQQMRPTKEKAVFHSILSFHPDEKPSDEVMMEIARKYLDRLGIVNTQFAVSKHTDKAHLHLHIVANLVNNEGKAISDSWIGLRGKKIAQQLTQEYNLIPALKKDLKRTHLEALSKHEAIKYKIYQAIAENLPLSRTMQELEDRLLKLCIGVQYKYKGQTQDKQGISFKMGNISFKGSQVDRQYSLAGLQKILAQQQLQTESKLRPNQPSEKLPLSPRYTKTHIINTSSSSVTGSESSQGPHLGHGFANALKTLLDPIGDGGGPVPYELTEEGRRKKKKKKGQHPH